MRAPESGAAAAAQRPPAPVERDPAQLFAAPRLELQRRPDGSLLLRSAEALNPGVRCVGAWLERWAADAPARICLAQRGSGGAWETLDYDALRRRVYAAATWLLHHSGDAPRPLAVLSDNSIDHAVLSLAAQHVGIPVASVSTAYSLASSDHAKLKTLIRELDPGAIYVDDAGSFAPALAAIAPLHSAAVVAARGSGGGVRPFEEVLAVTKTRRVRAAYERVGPDTLAKVLYTSGSTGEPKGVLNTQRMLCSNQEARAQIWPFLEQTPPLMLDWLPWNHTFGANHNFNMVLRNGGTLYIDAGKPMPGRFEASLANLREIAPTIYCNVPRGYDMLVAALKADRALRRQFFSRLQVLFYAAAALPQHLWEGLMELSTEATGRALPMVSAWGTTETAPLATDCHFQAPRSGNIGVPVPGCELKLVPAGEAHEIRVRGPNITPGYWNKPEQTRAAFDEEGFYLTGDAVRFADPQRPEQGLVFDGRITEDFKLSSGTWVRVGPTRLRAVECLAPLAQDAVVAGHDGDYVALLVFPNLAACRQLAGLGTAAHAAAVLAHPAVRAAVQAGLRRLRQQGGGSSSYAQRCILLAEPPSLDAGEITDKGYINQRAVLRHRAGQVERLFAEVPDADVIAL